MRCAGTFQQWKGGVQVIPGCLTSEDEERETWTAESLRGLGYLKTSVFLFRGRTKDFGGTRLHRLRDRWPRCESQAAGRLRPAKNGGTSSNVVISRFEVSSPT